jgi:hypothetical protein
MRAEKAVAALLTADSGVAALVGTQVYGGSVPQNTAAPLVVYLHGDGSPVDAQRVMQEAVWSAQIEVLCVAATYTALKALAEAVRLALAFQSGVIAGVQVLAIVCANKGRDQYDPELAEHGQVLTFNVLYQE